MISLDELKPIVAQNISELRTAHGITQIELAERLNYSDKAVSKWERGESLPDVAVLTEIADIFGVSLDYLVKSEHEQPPPEPAAEKTTRVYNHGFITGISIILVWLAAITAFVVSDILTDTKLNFFAFLYAVPVTMIVWLIFNCIWFNKRRNFLIISLLMWSVLAVFFVTLLPFGLVFWQLFLLGVPGQIIILLWSRLRYKKI